MKLNLTKLNTGLGCLLCHPISLFYSCWDLHEAKVPQAVLAILHNAPHSYGKQTAARRVINLGQSDSVYNTWRSHCWQHAKVMAIHGNAPEFHNWIPGQAQNNKYILCFSLFLGFNTRPYILQFWTKHPITCPHLSAIVVSCHFLPFGPSFNRMQHKSTNSTKATAVSLPGD